MSSLLLPDPIGEALFPAARREVLRLLFGDADRAFFVRDIARRAGLGYGHAQRELRRLHRAGILTRREEGQHVYYQANSRCPVYDDLRGLVTKTFGVAGRLRAALAPLAARIDVAFIYGSVARHQEGSESDLDLMVIGTATLQEIVTAIRPEEERLGREVTPSTYGPEEARARADTHFLRSVLSGEKVFVVGSEGELERLLA